MYQKLLLVLDNLWGDDLEEDEPCKQGSQEEEVTAPSEGPNLATKIMGWVFGIGIACLFFYIAISPTAFLPSDEETMRRISTYVITYQATPPPPLDTPTPPAIR